MTIDQAANQIITWLRKAVLVVLLISLAVILLKTFGVQLPVRSLGHVELAYLAGSYYLTK